MNLKLKLNLIAHEEKMNMNKNFQIFYVNIPILLLGVLIHLQTKVDT